MKGTQREAIKLLSSLCNTGNMVNILANHLKHVHNSAYNPRKKWNLKYVKEHINFKEMC